MSAREIRYSRDANPNQWLKDLAKELGLRGKNRLFAMSETKDPFNKGTEGAFKKAAWFKRVYEKFGYPGIHLRRLHYRMVHSKETLTLWDGETKYLNIELHWDKLQEAFTVARILRVVEAENFVDKHNKAVPTLLQTGTGVPEVGYWTTPPSYIGALPMAQDASSLPQIFGFTPYEETTFEVYGYDYSPDMQPSIIEIWSEAEEVSLHDLAHEYGINYIPGLGFQTLTAIKTLLRRLEASGKPGIVLYVADFDPAGQAMSISVARHCQFACWELEEIAAEVAPSIKVDNVAVTREQVEELGIPRIPIKATDLRRARFELTHGEGAVEVEALDAIHPGYIRRRLVERIEDLQDADLADEVAEQRCAARQAVREAIGEVMQEHRETLADIERRAKELEERYSPLYEQLGEQVAERYGRLAARFDRHRHPLHLELQDVQDEITQALDDLDVELPELPGGDADEDEDREWLFDSDLAGGPALPQARAQQIL